MNDRLEKVMHYVVRWSGGSGIALTKLAKILWFSDIEFYRKNGRTITGLLHYEKRPHGPFSESIYSALDILKQLQFLAERQDRVGRHKQRTIIWLSEPSVEEFRVDELETIHRVIEWIGPMTAAEVSRLTHDAYWEELEDREPMSVAAASVVPSQPSSRDVDWARAQSL